jgi:hypothetical protein
MLLWKASYPSYALRKKLGVPVQKGDLMFDTPDLSVSVNCFFEKVRAKARINHYSYKMHGQGSARKGTYTSSLLQTRI